MNSKPDTAVKNTERASAPLLVVAGTGTGIGKTVVARGLLRCWGRRALVVGLKPVESGGSADAEELGQASTFHVTRFTSPYLLADPVSPHLAARRDGRAIDLSAIATWVADVRAQAEAVVLEFAGGLFTPLTETQTNADLVQLLAPSRTILVAPDRLGVLHDVLATVKAAAGEGIRLDGIVLSAPDQPDLSTGTNAEELGRVLSSPKVLAVLPRTDEAGAQPLLGGVLDSLLLSPG